MASNSTPKIKAYRLEQGYNSSMESNDIRTMTNDEMLPIVKKDPNPFRAEEMVGVRARPDGRLVKQGSTVQETEFTLVSEQASVDIIQTIQKHCEGWVLGKGNIDVYVYRCLTTDYVDETTMENASENSSSDGTIPSYVNPTWERLDRKYWDYSIESKKTFRYVNGTSVEFTSDVSEIASLPPETDYEIHEMDWISFRLGAMLTKGNAFFDGGYESYVPITKIRVKYIVFTEFSALGTGDAYRLPFGDVYNGNRNGRVVHPKVSGSSSSQPSHLLDGKWIDDAGKMNYFEGNYLYRRKIYPLRLKYLGSGDTNFVQDAPISNGSADVPCEQSWFLDGIMKPVVFERIYFDSGRTNFVYKKLENKQVNVMYKRIDDGSSTNGNYCSVTLMRSYYTLNSESANTKYPTELFLAYNYVDDCLGELFDFNYNYATYSGTTLADSTAFQPVDPNDQNSQGYTDGIGYGYANNGLVVGTVSSSSVVIRHEIIATVESEQDAATDLLMTNNGTTASFTIAPPATLPSVSNDASFEETEECNEQLRMWSALGRISWATGIDLYYGDSTTPLCHLDGASNSSVSNVSINGVTVNVELTPATSAVTIQASMSGALAFLSEIMVAYYEGVPITFAKTSGQNPENPLCMGYRVACYEKQKTAKLFVSSFPNWLKGHVNNDLDIFYGNKLYSGVEVTTSSAMSNYHDIYPAYLKDGWYPMYDEGAIEFAEEKTEQDYFDIFNFESSVVDTMTSSNSNNSSSLYDSILLPSQCPEDAPKLAQLYKKVKCNVARIDGLYSVMRGRMTNFSHKNGIYSYKLMDDSQFSDGTWQINGVIDRRFPILDKSWVGSDTSVTRRMFESGRDQIPKVCVLDTPDVADMSTDPEHRLEVLSDIVLGNGAMATVNTENERVSTFLVESTSGVDFHLSNVPTIAEKCLTTPSFPTGADDIVVKAKISNGCLMIGTAVASGVQPCYSTADGISYVMLPDLDDCYDGIGIESVQTSETTIDATSGKYWSTADEPAISSDDLKTLSGGLVAQNSSPAQGDSLTFRYRYHNSDAKWAYDVFFEVLSYRRDAQNYNNVTGVELIAYIEYKK